MKWNFGAGGLQQAPALPDDLPFVILDCTQ
jgi:hypothetical protein